MVNIFKFNFKIEKFLKELLISSILVFLFLASAQAENARKTKSLRDLIELEYEMFKSTKLLIKEDSSKLKEILILEKLVELYCFEINLDDEELKNCEKHIVNLKKLHLNNIFIKCYESKKNNQCEEEFKKEVVLSVADIEELEKKNKFIKNIWDKEQSFINLRLKLEQYRTKEDGKSIIKEIAQLKKELKDLDDKERAVMKNTIKKNYQNAIHSLCKSSKVVYVKEIVNYNRNFLFLKSRRNNSDETKALIDSINELQSGFNPEIKTKEEEDKLIRVKILTKKCLDVLEDAYDFNPKIGEIYCFLESFSSPSCKKYGVEFKNNTIVKQKLNLSSF